MRNSVSALRFPACKTAFSAPWKIKIGAECLQAGHPSGTMAGPKEVRHGAGEHRALRRPRRQPDDPAAGTPKRDRVRGPARADDPGARRHADLAPGARPRRRHLLRSGRARAQPGRPDVDSRCPGASSTGWSTWPRPTSAPFPAPPTRPSARTSCATWPSTVPRRWSWSRRGEMLERWRSVFDQVPTLRRIVVVDGGEPDRDDTVGLAELEATGAAERSGPSPDAVRAALAPGPLGPAVDDALHLGHHGRPQGRRDQPLQRDLPDGRARGAGRDARPPRAWPTCRWRTSRSGCWASTTRSTGPAT